MTDTYSVTWARSEKEAEALQALGWKVAEQRPSHHSFYSVLMKWDGDGEPKLPPK